MKFVKQKIEGVFLIKHKGFSDKRGLFSRVYCKKIYKKLRFNPVQTNISYNKKKNTLRGFHYQISKSSEKKIITCVKGKIYDIVIDLRKKSKTYKKWISFKLSSKNLNSIFVPKGCANAFLTLENDSIVFYHTSNYYYFKNERGLRYNDQNLKFKWPSKIKTISTKDKNFPLYNLA